MQTSVPIEVKGHIKIVDDLGNILLDKSNAIHPQNIARVIARALANESNYFINRIAFGNGGTTVNAAFAVTYNHPNDGQSPDTGTWDSRLYHETYSEIVNSGQTVLNPMLGYDLGSADPSVGVRTGGGAVPSGDPASIVHISGPGVRSSELMLISEVVISSFINGSEPLSQFVSDTNAPTNQTTAAGDFVFDEIGLFTAGSQAISTSGYQYINVGTRNSTSDTGLLPGQPYSFDITVDGGTPIVIAFTTPIAGGSGVGGQILYGDLCQAINSAPTPAWGLVSGLPGGATMSITDLTSGTFSTITGAMTYGFLRVESHTAGSTSQISLAGTHTDIFNTALNPPIGASLVTAVIGVDAGLQNQPNNPVLERERLLTHLIFSPVVKTANRSLAITYTLTVSVARTV
jgi:hypothetical protein